MSPWRPSAVPQTTAWSGVSSQSRPASATTCSIERAWAIVFWSVRRYAASIARIIAPVIVTAGIARARMRIDDAGRDRGPADAGSGPRSGC